MQSAKGQIGKLQKQVVWFFKGDVLTLLGI